MKTMSVGDFKTNFSAVLKEVEDGQRIAITYGRKKEVKAMLIPNEVKSKKRKLGVWVGKASFKIKNNFKITDEEFLGL
jgi:antitoxin (DNA-binding transcriptional repressor) of toxin-antitoxin stability system